MPKNKVIYVAILVIAASGLLYLGNVLTTYVMPILPWATGVGIVGLVAGVFMEAKGAGPVPRDEERPL